jgi:predicted acyltransferase
VLQYLAIYFVGLVLGVVANVWLDVQLRKPALSRQIVLAALGIVLAVVIYQWSTSPELWIMYGLWASTGVLAGLGSRESRDPVA